MGIETINQELSKAMTSRIESLDADLMKLRTGRASISLLSGVKVDYYGNLSPLNQVASLSTPDAKTIVITPYEKSLIPEIEKSIMKADLGIQPTNDGKVVRLPIPQLTEERRKDIVKALKKIGEEAKVGIRGLRRDANDKIKKLEKEGLSEDESKRHQAEVQKQTDSFIAKIDEKMGKKEKEIMTV